MCKEDFNKWMKRIELIMITDGESQEFVEFAMDWFSSFKCNDECDLIQNYHPNDELANADTEIIYDFVSNVRLPLFEDNDFFDLQCFDSAFFLYRPLLKIKFLKEPKIIKNMNVKSEPTLPKDLLFTKKSNIYENTINVNGFSMLDVIPWFESRFVMLKDLSISENDLENITLKWEYLSKDGKIEVTKFYLDYFKLMNKYDSKSGYKLYSDENIISIEYLLQTLMNNKNLIQG